MHMITVFQYGLGAPVDWAHDCEQQLIGRRRLWNALVQIDRAAREEYRSALASVSPELAAAETSMDALVERKESLWVAIKARRQRERSKDVRDGEERAHIALVRQQMRDLAPALKSLRKDARETAKPLIAEVDARRRESVKHARQTEQSGLWWPNYNAVIASYETARRKALKEGATLQTRHYDGEGALTAQIIGGASVDEVMTGKTSQVSIGGALETGKRRYDRSLTMTVCTSRVDGEHRRRTVTFPLFLDRPLPPDARVQEVTCKRTRIGEQFRWTVGFLLRVPVTKESIRQGIACAVHIAWRKVGDGLRVATVAGEDGRLEHVSLTAEWLRRREWVDTLQSRLDGALNEETARLRSTWPDDAPEDLQRLSLSFRRAPKPVYGRLAALAVAWRAHPEYRPDIGERLESWRRQDKRQRLEMLHLRDKLETHRREHYRVLAARLRERYAVSFIDGIDLREAAKLVDDETKEENPLHAQARLQRVLASPYSLKLALRGAEIVDHSGTTSTCSRCGAPGTVPDDDVFWSCAACGTLHDRDENAALNLLRVGRASAQVAKAATHSARSSQSAVESTRDTRTRHERMRDGARRKRESEQRSQRRPDA